MRIYTCNACLNDDHEHCEKSHHAPEGHFGGSRCNCLCRGRSKKQWQEDEEKEAIERLKKRKEWFTVLKKAKEDGRNSSLRF